MTTRGTETGPGHSRVDPPASDAGISEADPTAYKEALLRETREELQKADNKASILLAASGIVFAAVLTAATTIGWDPDRLTVPTARITLWVAIGLITVGIVLIAAAVKPRLRIESATHEEIDYFGDVEAYWPRWWQFRGRQKQIADARQRFVHALSSGHQRQRYRERVDDQIWTLSHIAFRKYQLISYGFYSYAAALAAGIVTLVLEKRWL